MQGVFLGLLNHKPIHGSAVQHPAYKILNPPPPPPWLSRMSCSVLALYGPWTVGTVGLAGLEGSVGTYFGGHGTDGGGNAVDINASSKASRAAWYGVKETRGVGGGLAVGTRSEDSRMDGGGEVGGVNIGGCGKANSPRHL